MSKDPNDASSPPVVRRTKDAVTAAKTARAEVDAKIAETEAAIAKVPLKSEDINHGAVLWMIVTPQQTVGVRSRSRDPGS